VFDKMDRPVGLLSAGQLIVATPDGPVALDSVTPTSYEGPYAYLYTSADCSGQAYWEVSSLSPLGRIMGENGMSTDEDGNVLFSGKLTYAAAPLSPRVINSHLSEGQCSPYGGDGITLLTGPAATMDVNWQAPLRVGN
jgi:hypothetical protein